MDTRRPIWIYHVTMPMGQSSGKSNMLTMRCFSNKKLRTEMMCERGDYNDFTKGRKLIDYQRDTDNCEESCATFEDSYKNESGAEQIKKEDDIDVDFLKSENNQDAFSDGSYICNAMSDEDITQESKAVFSSPVDNKSLYSYENCVTFEVNQSISNCDVEVIKSEDCIDFISHDLKSEKVVEEGREVSQCELCKTVSPSNFSSLEGFRSSCNCQVRKELNAVQDPETIRSEIREKAIIGKEEEANNENMSPTLYQNEFGVENNHIVKHEMIHSSKENSELFKYELCSKSIEARIHEQNQICSKNSNEINKGSCSESHLKTYNVEQTCCEICSKSIGERPFECKLCSKPFNQYDSLKSHEKIHTRTLHNQEKTYPGEKPFQCEICTRSFFCRSALNTHLRSHTGEKPFNCGICSKSFRYINSLREHEKTHTGEKPYQCAVCSKGFIGRSAFKNHIRIHTGEKPFTCIICSKSFNRRGNLTEHGKIHTGLKPFQCEVCSKSFIRRRDLTIHSRTHTGEKPYNCKYCSKSYSHLRTLNDHEKTHTGTKPFQCEICSRFFIRRGDLLLHLKTHRGKTI